MPVFNLLGVLSPFRWYAAGGVAAIVLAAGAYTLDSYGDYRAAKCEAKYSDAFVSELQASVKVQTAIAVDRAARATELEAELAELAAAQKPELRGSIGAAPVGGDAEWLRGHQRRAAKRNAAD